MNTADLVHKELFRKSVEITRLGGLLSEKDAEIAALQEKVKYLQNDNADRYTRIKELEASLQIAEEWRVKERLKNIELEEALKRGGIMLSDTGRKLLTEYLGECWHDIIEVYGNRFAPARAINKCSKCGWTYAKNRTFTTWQDLGDLKDKLVEKGEWESFLLWGYINHFLGIEAYEALYPEKDLDQYCCQFDTDYITWLINTSRFPELVAEWLKSTQLEDRSS